MLQMGTFLLLAAVAALHVVPFMPSTAVADESEPVMDYVLTKKFSGPYPEGYAADQFTFDVVGTSASGTPISMTGITLTEYTEDTADTTIELPRGEYTITENGPDGFEPDEWVIQWSDPKGCEQQTAESTTITIDDDNFGLGNVGCRADNQWFPEEEEGPGSASNQGVLEVVKVIAGTTTVAFDAFSFNYSGTSSGGATFETDGSNLLSLATGTYSVAEVAVSGYTATYSNCTDVVVTAGATTTCTITNTLDTNGGGGGGNGGNNDEEYLVFGYVWHDENENEEWDQGDESDLEGWTVEITNGSTTHATTTDQSGYYYFMVPAGTWTINEIVQDDWAMTFPNDNGHVVVVGEEDEDLEVVLSTNDSFLAAIVGLFINTAHAQSVVTYGPFNFGNVQFGSGGGGSCCSGGGSSSGGSSSSASSGGGTGGGEVLGDQVTIVPVAAANAGFGGAATNTTGAMFTILSFALSIIAWVGVRRVRNVR